MPEADAQEILQRLTRVETKLDMMINARDIAQEALQSTKVAHHRLDKIDKTLFWLFTTFGAAFIIALVAFVIKGGSMK